MISEFFRTPVDFETTYVVMFGTVAMFGVTIVLLDWLAQRRQRRSHPHRK
jgi:hypothetical protein